MDYTEEQYLRNYPAPVFINDIETILKQMKKREFLLNANKMTNNIQ